MLDPSRSFPLNVNEPAAVVVLVQMLPKAASGEDNVITGTNGALRLIVTVYVLVLKFCAFTKTEIEFVPTASGILEELLPLATVFPLTVIVESNGSLAVGVTVVVLILFGALTV